MLDYAVQCTSCNMYACLDQKIEGVYCCPGCVRVAQLEAEVAELNKHLATLRCIHNMEKSLDLTIQTLDGTGEDEEGGIQSEREAEVAASWVTVRRGRGKSDREASPELSLSNRYACLRNIGEDDSGVAMLQQDVPLSNQGADCCNEKGNRSAAKARQVLVVGDSIIRHTDRVICRRNRECRTVCCLPGARVRHVAERIDRLLGGAGDDPAVMVHIGTNDKVSGRWKVLKNDFQVLGDKLKARTSKVVFSEILPVPRATSQRQKELRELNKWLRNWCRKEGFGFLENWADFAVGYRFYSRDGLHLNGEGAAALGEKMAKRLEEILN